MEMAYQSSLCTLKITLPNGWTALSWQRCVRPTLQRTCFLFVFAAPAMIVSKRHGDARTDLEIMILQERQHMF